jgi:hypothetical protein
MFAANCVITVRRHDASYDMESVVRDVDSELAELPEVSMLDPIDIEVEGVPCHSRVISYRDATAGTLAQLHVLIDVPNEPFRDVLHIVASCAGDQVESDFPALQQVAASLALSLAPTN